MKKYQEIHGNGIFVFSFRISIEVSETVAFIVKEDRALWTARALATIKQR